MPVRNAPVALAPAAPNPAASAHTGAAAHPAQRRFLIQSVLTDGQRVGIRFHHIDGIKKVIGHLAKYIGDAASVLHKHWVFDIVDVHDVEKFEGMLAEIVELLGGAPGAAPLEIRVRTAILEWQQLFCAAQEQPVEPAPFDLVFRLTIHRYVEDVVVSRADSGSDSVKSVGYGTAIFSAYTPKLVSWASKKGGKWLPRAQIWKIPDMEPEEVISELVDQLRYARSTIESRAGLFEVLETGVRNLSADSLSAKANLASQIKEMVNRGLISKEEVLAFSEGVASRKLSLADKTDADAENGVPEAFHEKSLTLLARCLHYQDQSHISAATAVQICRARYQAYDYQVEAVGFMAARRSALNADDMGLGKTRTAIITADIVRGRAQVAVVCPASLVFNWKTEIEMVAPKGTKVSIGRYDPAADYVICNYDRLDNLMQSRDAFRVVLIDEAHCIKEMDIDRTRLVFQFCQDIEFRYLLTGTPVMNRVGELYSLLKLSGHQLAKDLSSENFSKTYRNPAAQKLLREALEGWMIRREKHQVLKHLKGKKRNQFAFEMASEYQDRYAKALVGDPNPLTRLNALRKIVEESKIPYIIDRARHMAPDDKMIVFTEFTETVDVIVKRLAMAGLQSVRLIGSDSLKSRQESVERFQRDRACRVFVGTNAAAGVGITLTAANIVMFACLPWTAALQEQAEDRAYRNGQQRLVLVDIPIALGTVDQNLAILLQQKTALFSTIIEGKSRSWLTEGTAAQALLHILRKQPVANESTEEETNQQTMLRSIA